LDVVLSTPLLVLCHRLFLEQILQLVVGVAAYVAYGHPGVFTLVPHHLDQIPAPLFGQRRHRHPDNVTLCCRIEAQVGIAYGFLDRGDHLFLPRADTYRAAIDQGHVGHLRQRRRVTVVIHHHVIQQAGVRAPGPDLAQIGLQRLDRLFHLLFSVFLHFSNHRRLQSDMHHRTFILTHHHPFQRLRLEYAEDVDRQFLVATERQRRRVHH